MASRTNAKRLFADLGADHAVVFFVAARRPEGQPHGLSAAAAACALAAAAAHTAIDDLALPKVRLPMRFNYAQLGIPRGALDRPVELGDAVLAGAGAVAHGFLRAARHLDLRGQLDVIDPKAVQEGILNRCLYLKEDDIGSAKAEALTYRAMPDFPALRLRPYVADLRTHVRTLGRPPACQFASNRDPLFASNRDPSGCTGLGLSA